MLDLYRTVPGWDIVMHLLCTAAIAAVAFEAGVRARVWPERPARTPVIVTTVLAGAASAVWEMIEWAGWRFVTEDIFVAYEDTIGDMAVGTLGGLAAGILIARTELIRADAARSERITA